MRREDKNTRTKKNQVKRRINKNTNKKQNINDRDNARQYKSGYSTTPIRQNITDIRAIDRDEHYRKRKHQQSYRSNINNTKNRNLQILSKIFMVSIFAVITIYFVVSISKGINKKSINYETVMYGTINEKAQAKGVIIRNEKVYNSTKSGMLNFDVPDNEKVRKGEIIASIQDKETISTNVEDLQKINQQILKIQEQRGELSLFSDDIKRVNDEIQKTLNYSVSDFFSYDMSEIYETIDVLDKKITIKNQMLLSENLGSISSLSEKRNVKEQEINKNIQKIYTTDAGIISYSIDGLEDVLTVDNMIDIVKEQTNMKTEEQTTVRLNINENEPIFKVVKSNTFYIASYIDIDELNNWEKGDEKTIYVTENSKINSLNVLVEEIEKGDKEAFVLMSCNRHIIDFINKRNIKFEINLPKEGLKINKEAIVEEKLIKIPVQYLDGQNVIKKMPEGNVNMPLDIVQEIDGVVSVRIVPGGIDTGDTIINMTTGEEYNINEIFTMKGIYIINTGIPSIININPEGSVENDQFIILDANKNKHIEIYDRYTLDINEYKNNDMTKK